MRHPHRLDSIGDGDNRLPARESIDAWLTLGSVEWDEDRVRGRRTWLKGVMTGGSAEVVQFAAYGRSGESGFAETFAAGCVQPMALAFHPSAAPRRAVVVGRESEPIPVPLPPGRDVAGMLDEVADELAACPFRTRFATVLAGVTPLVVGDEWWLRDAAGAGVRLSKGPSEAGREAGGGGCCRERRAPA